MRARFGIASRLQYYTTELLTTIVEKVLPYQNANSFFGCGVEQCGQDML
jgi:Holliday junction resolvasome RuvABC ATP-dependent DNA helicase subunit